MINFRDNVRGFLFQGRFHSCPVHTDDHLLAVVRYVERNPVQAQMVSTPWDYRWSSAGYHVDEVSDDPLITHTPLLSAIKDWRKFLQNELEADNHKLRETYRTGRPFGPTEFYDIVKDITGEDVRPKQPGRPKKQTVTCPLLFKEEYKIV